MSSTITDEDATPTTTVAKPLVGSGSSVTQTVENLGHDAAQAVSNAAATVVEAARDAGAALRDAGLGATTTAVSHSGLEPIPASEHKAKMIAEQEKLVGYGVVPAEGFPPEK